MVKILRVYPMVNGKEACVKEPEKIAAELSSLTEPLDLDYESGSKVKMGNSQDFIGETVKVGDDFEIEIQDH